MSTVLDERWRWTADRYFKAVASGFLNPDERFELIEGELIRVAPMNPRHGEAISRLNAMIFPQIDSASYQLRVQTPLAFSNDTWPEPDLAIVPASDYKNQHPSSALLVIEVADSSITRDQNEKLALYARNQVPEYWIVDIRDKAKLWVYCDPAGDHFETDVHYFDAYESVAVPNLKIDFSSL